MTPQQIKSSICALFEVQQDGETLVVSTPLNISGRDRIHVYVSPLGDGRWRLDDNGEVAFAAAMAGINTKTEQFQALVEASMFGGPPSILWDESDEALALDVGSEEIGMGCLALAHVASRLYLSAILPRKIKEKNDFRERILAIIDEVAEKSQIAIERDTPVTNELLVADCQLSTPIPTYIVVATSAIRLADAELMHSRLQNARKPGYVLAIVENIRSVGATHFTRATYLTDKTVEWDQGMFNALVQDRATHGAPAQSQ